MLSLCFGFEGVQHFVHEPLGAYTVRFRAPQHHSQVPMTAHRMGETNKAVSDASMCGLARRTRMFELGRCVLLLPHLFLEFSGARMFGLPGVFLALPETARIRSSSSRGSSPPNRCCGTAWSLKRRYLRWARHADVCRIPSHRPIFAEQRRGQIGVIRGSSCAHSRLVFEPMRHSSWRSCPGPCSVVAWRYTRLSACNKGPWVVEIRFASVFFWAFCLEGIELSLALGDAPSTPIWGRPRDESINCRCRGCWP